MPVELIVPGRSRKTIVDCSMPHDAGTPSAASTSACAQPGSLTQSLFRVATHVAGRGLDAAVAAFGEADVAGLRKEPACRKFSSDHRWRAVRRPVVDDDDLDVVIRLRGQRLEARPQVVARIPVDDDDGEPHVSDAARGNLPVHVRRLLSHSAQGEVLTPHDAALGQQAPLTDVAGERPNRLGDRFRTLGIDQRGGIAGHLDNRRPVAANHRAAARHRLDERIPETLDARHEQQRERSAHQGRQIAIRHVAEHHDRVSTAAAPRVRTNGSEILRVDPPRPCEHDVRGARAPATIASARSIPSAFLRQSAAPTNSRYLRLPEAVPSPHVFVVAGRRGGEANRVDAVVDDRDLASRDAEERDEIGRGRGADRDDVIGRAITPRVETPAPPAPAVPPAAVMVGRSHRDQIVTGHDARAPQRSERRRVGMGGVQDVGAASADDGREPQAHAVGPLRV